MAKIYYSIELKNGYSLACVHDEPKYSVSADYRNLLLNDCVVWNPVSVLSFLLNKETHLDPSGEKIVRGSFVAAVSKPFFVPE